jgi:hypothetical protein
MSPLPNLYGGAKGSEQSSDLTRFPERRISYLVSRISYSVPRTSCLALDSAPIGNPTTALGVGRVNGPPKDFGQPIRIDRGIGQISEKNF